MCIVAAGVVLAGVVVRVGVGVASQSCLLRGFFSRGRCSHFARQVCTTGLQTEAPERNGVRIPKFSRAGCSPGARSVHTASTPYKYFLPIGDFIRDAGQRDAEHFSVKTKDTATKGCLCEVAGLRLWKKYARKNYYTGLIETSRIPKKHFYGRAGRSEF